MTIALATRDRVEKRNDAASCWPAGPSCFGGARSMGEAGPRVKVVLALGTGKYRHDCGFGGLRLSRARRSRGTVVRRRIRTRDRRPESYGSANVLTRNTAICPRVLGAPGQ